MQNRYIQQQQNPSIQLQLIKQENERHNKKAIQESLSQLNPQQQQQKQNQYTQKNPILQSNYNYNEMFQEKRQLKGTELNQTQTYANYDTQWKSSQKQIVPKQSKDDLNQKRQLKEVQQNQRDPILEGQQDKQQKNRPESSQPWSHQRAQNNFFGQQNNQVLDNKKDISLKCGQVQFDSQNYQKKQMNFGIKKLNQDLNCAL